jgi:arylsulfatase A-like enzyme
VISSFPLRGEATRLSAGFGSYHESFDSAERNRKGQLVKTPEETTRAAAAWAEAHRERDFFLWVHYFPPHGPYTPPAEFLSGPEPVSQQGLPVSRVNFEEGAIPVYQRLEGRNDPEFYRRRYAGQVRYVDHYVGALLDRLRGLGIYDRALVVATSDHGESLGEHGWYFCHGNVVYQEQARIPLIAKLPAGARRGSVDASPVEGVDVAPTLLEAFGVQAAFMDGRSLLTPSNGTRARYTASSDAEVVAILDGPRKLMIRRTRGGLAGPSHPERALYRLDRDPQESRDVSSEEPEAAAGLAAELERRFGGIAAGGAPLDPEAEGRLRALGYLR